MRLIDTATFELRHFFDRIPPYAILSHTWTDEEITFQAFNQGWDVLEKAYGKQGFAKIKGLCQRARVDGLGFAWIDTACIDKTSSAELSEAINSMMSWYQMAKVCYAYLSDVQKLSQLPGSRWFRRGWTLQELIAPSSVQFYTGDWEYLGDKSTLGKAISEITGIDQLVLEEPRSFRSFSVATRMSWAAKRETTRIEDIAYCLLGIFDVNMPAAYGEGQRAFIRLQQELIKQSNDESIFAWHNRYADDYMGLAPEPSCFADVPGIVPLNPAKTNQPFALTNKGLQISLPLLEERGPAGGKQLWGILNCRLERCFLGYVGIPLAPSFTANIFFRDGTVRPRLISLEKAQTAEYQTIYIGTLAREIAIGRCICLVKSDSLATRGYKLIHPLTESLRDTWDSETQTSEVIYMPKVGAASHEIATVRRFIFHNADQNAAFAISLVNDHLKTEAGFFIAVKPETQESRTWVDEICQQPSGTFNASEWDELKLHTAEKIQISEGRAGNTLWVIVRLVKEELLQAVVWLLDVSAGDGAWLENPDSWGQARVAHGYMFRGAIA